VLSMEDWAEIRRLHRAEGVSIKEIARLMGLARNTVRRAVRADEPPSYKRKSGGSGVDAHEPAIRRLLAEFPRMPATVIAERIGWTGGRTFFRERVAELRPIYLPADPCQRTDYRPGELAQWDLWFPEPRIPLDHGQEAMLPVIVGVSGYSRVIVARMIPTRKVHDILLGHLACLVVLGGVPRKGVYDNEAALVSRHGGRPTPTQAFQRFRGALGMGVVVNKPATPRPRGWWSGPTATWRPASCLAGASPRRSTSTTSSHRGCPPRMTGSTPRCAVDRRIASTRTAPP
jgi:transposase